MLKRYLIALFIVSLVFFLPVPIISTVRDGAVQVVSPVGRFLISHSTSARAFILNIRQLGNVRAEKVRLQQELVHLQEKLIEQEDIRQENETLRKEVGVTGVTREFPKLFARVILRGPDLLDRSFIIDIGNAEGVRVGQPAVYQGVLIGKVIEVREHSAVVRAVTSQKSITQARIATNREQGALVGTGNGLVLQQITQGVQVPGESVIETSGLGGTLPEGILIGSVDTLISSPSDTTQRFTVRQEVDLAQADSMFILQVNPE